MNISDIREIPSYIVFLISEYPFLAISAGVVVIVLLLRKAGYLSSASGFDGWINAKNIILFSIFGTILGIAGGALFFIYHYGFQGFFIGPPEGEVFVWLPPYVLYIIPGAFIGFTVGFLVGAWKGSRRIHG